MVFTQCTKEDVQITKLKQDLKKQYGIKLDKEINRIYILNDMGCGTCISSLSRFVKDYVNDDKAMVLINSRGINVDLDAFEMKKQANPNIIINHTVINEPDNRFACSGAIYIKQEKIDTIIKIEGENIVQQLQYIFGRK